MTRVLSPAGLDLISTFEGLRLTAYQDQAGIWTIGYGHAGDVQVGDHVSSDQARQLLAQDTHSARVAVDGAINGHPTTDNQFAAMVSLAYNIGGSAFRSSSVLRAHNAGDFMLAATCFLLWDKAHVDGALVTLPGLLRRREAEAAMYRSVSVQGATA